jgi:hypothetical protein
MRQVVEDAVARTLGGSVRIEAVLKSDAPPHVAPKPNGAASTVSRSGSGSSEDSKIPRPISEESAELGLEAGDDGYVRNAEAIFDAKEIV